MPTDKTYSSDLTRLFRTMRRLITPKLLRKLAAAGIAFWLPVVIFMKLAGEVIEREPLPFDVPLLMAIHAHSNAFQDKLWLAVTSVGNDQVLAPVILLTVVGLWLTHRRRHAIIISVIVIGAAAANVVLKLLFHRSRPSLWRSSIVETGFSFPSGHAMMSCAFALAVIVTAWHTRYRYAVLVAGVTAFVAISYSRLYLGVHFPSDIMAGWLAAGVWTGIVVYVFSRHASWWNDSHRETAGHPKDRP